jgi:hypothetical protein
MPQFDADAERITVFHIDDQYLFSHYFDRTDIFDDLREYYVDETYRFEVPEEAFETVEQRLEDAYYDPVVVEELEPYCVVIDKYDEHADILRESVATWERSGHRFFLMQSDLAVTEACEQGATRIAETDFVVGL